MTLDGGGRLAIAILGLTLLLGIWLFIATWHSAEYLEGDPVMAIR